MYGSSSSSQHFGHQPCSCEGLLPIAQERGPTTTFTLTPGADCCCHTHPAPVAAGFGGVFAGERLGLDDLSPVLPAKSAFLSAILACLFLFPFSVSGEERDLSLCCCCESTLCVRFDGEADVRTC